MATLNEAVTCKACGNVEMRPIGKTSGTCARCGVYHLAKRKDPMKPPLLVFKLARQRLGLDTFDSGGW